MFNVLVSAVECSCSVNEFNVTARNSYATDGAAQDNYIRSNKPKGADGGQIGSDLQYRS